ncbi:MAG TPA: RHS repeat-associated core domain-containing protein [Candidatus Saccharimonadales bacterium]|nr:RHS repeat-associated core domain-containing protein [Candidatus Saccharimonadales bacterium]
MGGEPEAEECKALAGALAEYSYRTNLDDFSSLTDFLARFPQSTWAGSLLLHLGTEYYNYGYYSKALDGWEQAWRKSEHVKDAKTKIQADRALGELARIYSKLGRMRDLKELLDSTTNRPLTGPATQLIHAAQQALWMMQNRPEISFRCGPLALNSILAHSDPKKALNPLILNSKSTTNGFSLSQVGELSRRLGLNYQMAFRNPGAAFLVPAVVHWKAGHYAAMLQKEGDRFLVQDLTFRGSLRISATALDEEGSGYFLVPPGPLPAGWRLVPEQEADQIWGKGVVTGQNGNSTTPVDTHTGGDAGNCSAGGTDSSGINGEVLSGMTSYTMDTMLVSLNLHDTPVGYNPPVGPAVHFTATYNALEAGQPATFYYSNLGQKWTCNWIAYITDNPQSPGGDVSYYVDGGGTLNYTSYNSSTKSYAPELMTQSILLLTSSSSYELQYPDGSKKEFAQSDGATGSTRRIFLTQIIDPAGNSVHLHYDSQLRITNIVDAIGQSTTLFYTNTAYNNAITAVVDPFGREAHFYYYSSSGMLSQITDVLGLKSQYIYGTNDFASDLVTPYGTTAFVSGATNGGTFLQVTDPLGESELLEFTQNSSLPFSFSPVAVPHGIAVYNAYMPGRDSFLWDKKAFAEGAWDVTKAKIYHFLHEPDITTESSVLESVQAPLENMVWYNYPGQLTNDGTLLLANNYSWVGAAVIGTSSEPSVVGRVLDDGTSQLSCYQYNLLGHVTNSIDPVGRNFTYVYSANNVDLVQTLMTHNGKSEIQGSITYNSHHLPLTITDASGQITTNTFNAQGHLLSTSNPKGELTTFNYDTNGYLTNILGHLQSSNDIRSFTYDSFGRVFTATDTEGYSITNNYDAADRKTQVIHPDGTYEQFVYSNLDLIASADRLGRWTTNAYNADRQLVQTQDPLGRITRFEWCRCGALAALIDPMGRQTSWDYDVQSRPIAKHYPDGSTVTYAYENTTSRLASKFDEQGQQTVYQYYADNNLKGKSYPNAIISTPSVAFTYDHDYNRILTMQDGIGLTVYTYNPISPTPVLGAGRLASISGPFSNSTVTYQYDQLGRVVSRAINGAAQATTYDVLGRPIIVTNSLGSFNYAYLDATSRLASEAYPNGLTNFYTYYNISGDERLQQITHQQANGNILSSFTYQYNSAGQVTAEGLPIDNTTETYGYDASDQLASVETQQSFPGTGLGPISTFTTYTYDLAGNRLTVTQGGGSKLGPPSTQQFSYSALNQLTGASPAATNSATYEWDAENRLTAINQGTNRSAFSYDGLGRRVEIVEKTNGVVQSANYYLWCGAQICEMRDASGATTLRRLFPQGESLVGANANTNYFYTKDHLGSVREALDSNGELVTRYSYDPYGQKSILEEGFPTTFGFTGDFVHQKSGLYLTWFRALDSASGRWLSRDPLGEKINVNVYSYVGNNPINFKDLLGLCDTDSTDLSYFTDAAHDVAMGEVNPQGYSEGFGFADAGAFVAQYGGYGVVAIGAITTFSGFPEIGIPIAEFGSGWVLKAFANPDAFRITGTVIGSVAGHAVKVNAPE